MKAYYWTVENWGKAYPPENAQEICDRVNEYLDNYEGGESEVYEESAFLWENYCAAHRA